MARTCCPSSMHCRSRRSSSADNPRNCGMCRPQCSHTGPWSDNELCGALTVDPANVSSTDQHNHPEHSVLVCLPHFAMPFAGYPSRHEGRGSAARAWGCASALDRPAYGRTARPDRPSSGRGGSSSLSEQAVRRGLDPGGTAVEDVGVDHRGGDVLVAEQLLHGADVASVFEQMRGKRVPERVAGRALGDAGRQDRAAHGLLHDRFVQVVAALLA